MINLTPEQRQEYEHLVRQQDLKGWERTKQAEARQMLTLANAESSDVWGKAKAIGNVAVDDYATQWRAAADAINPNVSHGATTVAGGVGRRALNTLGVAGDTLDFGLRLASGENVARAGAGFAGSTAGWQLGAAAGTALIPIPIVGTVAGGLIGSFIGDWAATKGYEALTEDEIEVAHKEEKLGLLNRSLSGVDEAQKQARSQEINNWRAENEAKRVANSRNTQQQIMQLSQRNNNLLELPEII